MQKCKWWPEDVLQIPDKRREAKAKEKRKAIKETFHASWAQ